MKNKHLPLIIAILLPLIFIGAVALAVLLPSFSVKPTHNFVYVFQNTDYYAYNNEYKSTYEVKEGKIVKVALTPRDNVVPLRDIPKLYFYDVNLDSSHEISFENAQKFSYDAGPSSPDGYVVTYDYSHDGIFEIFGSNGRNGYVVSKGNAKKNLPGIVGENGYSYYGNFRLVGWVK